MDSLYQKIHDIGIIPVITLHSIENAAPLARALCNGGLLIAKVAYSDHFSHDFIVEMKNACPEMLIGADAIQTRTQVDSVVDAGAAFLILPKIDAEIIKYCQGRNVPVIPGASKAEDIEAAVALGLDTLYFSSAENFGGVNTLRDLSASYANVTFIASGGITQNNINAYLNERNVLACAASWMIDEKAVADGNFGKIEELTREAVYAMLGFTIKHIGINEEGGEGEELADKFAKLFCGKVRETSKGWFGSESIEIMSKGRKVGRHGHIGIGVNHPDRAKRYYESLGYSFQEDTAEYDENGSLRFIYLAEEVSGFAMHIIKN